MANKKLWLGILVMALVFGMTILGCKGMEDLLKTDTYSYSFINQSSYTVSISCSDLNPSDFTVAAGQTKTATSSKSGVQVTWGPSNYVNRTTEPGKFIFTNKY